MAVSWVGGWLAIASTKNLHMLATNRAQTSPKLVLSHETISCVEFSSTADLLAIAIRHEIQIWKFNSTSGTLKPTPMTILKDRAESSRDIKFLRDDARLASASSDATVKIWNVKNGALVHCYEHGCEVLSLASTHYRSRLVSGRWDGSVHIHDASMNDYTQQGLSFEGHTSQVRFVRALGRNLTVSGSDDGTIKMFDIEANTHSSSIRDAVPPRRRCLTDTKSLILSHDGRTLIRLDGTSVMRSYIIDESGQSTTGGHFSCDSLAPEQVPDYGFFSPDDRYLATVCTNAKLVLWAVSVESLHPLIVLKADKPRQGSIKFSPDSSMLAWCGQDGRVTLLNVRTPSFLLDQHCAIQRVAFHPDGSLFATADDQGCCRVYYTGCSEMQREWKTRKTERLFFTRDNKYIGTGQHILRIDSIHKEYKKTHPVNDRLPRSRPKKRDLRVQDQWIMAGQQRLLLLPVDYCSQRIAVGDAAIVLWPDSDVEEFMVIRLNPQILMMNEAEANSSEHHDRYTIPTPMSL